MLFSQVLPQADEVQQQQQHLLLKQPQTAESLQDQNETQISEPVKKPRGRRAKPKDDSEAGAEVEAAVPEKPEEEEILAPKRVSRSRRKPDIEEANQHPPPSASEVDRKSSDDDQGNSAVPSEEVDTTKVADVEAETEDLLRQKGVTLSKEGKVMIPSQKLTLSEELCKVVESGKKKHFVCQVCEKSFLRKDKTNYHIYQDHHDEFVRFGGKGLPKILQQNDETASPSKSTAATPPNAAAVSVAVAAVDNEAENEVAKAEEIVAEEKIEPEVEDSEIVERKRRPVKKYRKMAKCISNILLDVEFLVGVQEEHRRLRHRRRLTDSNNALKVLKKYRMSKKKATYAVEAATKNPLKLKLKRNDFGLTPFDPENPFKLKISKNRTMPEIVENQTERAKDEQMDEPLAEVITPEPKQEVAKVQIDPSESVTPAPKRSRLVSRSKKLDAATKPEADEKPMPEAAKEATEVQTSEPIVQPVIQSPKESPEKKRGRPARKETQAETASQKQPVSEPVTQQVEEPSVQEQVEKRRGRPPRAVETPAESKHVPNVTPEQPEVPKEEVKMKDVEAVEEKPKEIQEKRRGRPQKKDVSEVQEAAKPEVIPEQLPTAEPAKQTPGSEKRRGRPPKRETSMEAKLPVLNENEPENKMEPVEEKEVVEAKMSNQPIQEQAVDKVVVQEMDHSPPAIIDKKKPLRGRGRAKKIEVETDEKEADEAVAELETEGPPKRSMRKRSSAAAEIEEQIKVAKLDLERPQVGAVAAKEQELVVASSSTASFQSPDASAENEEKKTLKMVIAAKEKPGLKIVLRPPEVASSSEANNADAKYVVQSSNENPLKIKLKSSMKAEDEERPHHHHKKHHHHHHHHEKGLKLKLLLKTSEGQKVIQVGESETENKDKKKKKHSDSNADEKESLVLRIKSPNPSEPEVGGGNGLHKITIQKSETSNSAEMNETPKLRKLDEAIKKYVAKMTEPPSKKKVTRRLSPGTKIGRTTSPIGLGLNHQDEKHPPIKTKIVLNRKSEDKSKEDQKQNLNSNFATASATTTTTAADNGQSDTNDTTREITQELSVRVTSFQPSTLANDSPVTQSASPTPVVAFSLEKKATMFSQDSKDEDDDDDIGLEKTTFNDLMKNLIDDDDGENDDVSMSNNVEKTRPTIVTTPTSSTATVGASSVAKQTSVEHLQVDGSADNWSRSSQSPPHSSADEIDSDENVIKKRIKQMQQAADSRPKSKLALIKRVFSTYTKNRKIVIVKYKKPELRLYDKEEYHERLLCGTLDVPYNEQDDDEKLKPPSALKRKGSATESEISSAAENLVQKIEETDPLPSSSDSTDFHCSECSRTFPNLIRYHAHMQIHKPTGSGKKRKLKLGHETSSPGKRKVSKIVEEEEERILQVDGETDLDDIIGDPTDAAQSTGATTSTTMTITQAANGQLVVNAPPSSAFSDFTGASIVFSSSSTHRPPTHLLILKRHPGDGSDTGSIIQLGTPAVTAAAQGTTFTATPSSYGGPFRCDQCSEGFRSRKALNNHCSNVHTVSKFTSVYPCAHCNSLFRLQSDLEAHIRLKSFKC